MTPLSAARKTKGRDKVKYNIERLLGIWIKDQGQRNMPVCFMMIKEKAISLIQNLNKELGECSAISIFSASHGWFQQFKHLCNLHSIKVTCKAASADLEVAKQCLQQPNNSSIIAEGGYSPQQVFNVDKTGLSQK